MSDLTGEPIEVVVEEYLADLVPAYLSNRGADVQTMMAAMESGDFETARSLGHQMKGSGGGYGFDRITEIGAAIEAASKEADRDALAAALADLSDYLARVTVRFE